MALNSCIQNIKEKKNMVKKLTIKTWTSTGLLLLVCLVIAIVPLWRYAPSALLLLQGKTPLVNESQTNIYGITAIGLFMLIISLVIFIKLLISPVGKRVNAYLEKHQGVTMSQLDEAFESAENFGNVWVSKRWTFSHDMQRIVAENEEIVRAYSMSERSRRDTNYYLCLEFTEGKSERVKMSYHNLSEILESYKKYSNIRVEHNV